MTAIESKVFIAPADAAHHSVVGPSSLYSVVFVVYLPSAAAVVDDQQTIHFTTDDDATLYTTYTKEMMM
jgi:hypothetical protein